MRAVTWYLDVFLAEAVQRARSQAEDGAVVEIAHVQSILVQLLLDF